MDRMYVCFIIGEVKERNARGLFSGAYSVLSQQYLKLCTPTPKTIGVRNGNFRKDT